MSRTQNEISGAEIARSTKLPSGTLYPILMRLEDAGWVESRWETEDPSELGRPRRRFYQVTGVGAKEARSALREVALSLKEFGWLW
jgi:DNA-binding PadR family transcriptional regulator